MLSFEHNELLTRVEGLAPMGRMMRESFWLPFSRSAALARNGDPQRLRLLGRDYVAFRAPDDRIGVFDEKCPHRGASLALARREGCEIRCIFHGWSFHVSGRVADVPTEPVERRQAFANKVKLRHYPVREAGGLAWVWLGTAAPPPLPVLPFFQLGTENVWITRTIAQCNWLQGVEGTLDSAHVGTLHQSWIQNSTARDGGTIGRTLHDSAPRYQVQETAYGLRAAALRSLPDGGSYVRVTEYSAPFVSMTAGQSPSQGSMFISTPVDDTHHLLFWGLWDTQQPVRPANDGLLGHSDDLDNYGALVGGPDNNWGQDRDAMRAGHFTGFTKTLIQEDMVVQASMGPIADRTRETLCASDIAVAHLRARLIDMVRRFEAGEDVMLRSSVGSVAPIDTCLPAGKSWMDLSRTAAPA